MLNAIFASYEIKFAKFASYEMTFAKFASYEIKFAKFASYEIKIYEIRKILKFLNIYVYIFPIPIIWVNKKGCYGWLVPIAMKIVGQLAR
jgi:hypothetical protein